MIYALTAMVRRGRRELIVTGRRPRGERVIYLTVSEGRRRREFAFKAGQVIEGKKLRFSSGLCERAVRMFDAARRQERELAADRRR